MMLSEFSKLLLRYLVFVGIPYVIGRRVEKFLTNLLDDETKRKINEDLKRFPEIDGVSSSSQEGLDNRGGTGLELWLTKVVVLDFGLKAAIVGGIGATIWSNTADNAAGNLLKFATGIIQAPGQRFKRFYRKIRGLNPQHTQDIREILLDRDLSVLDKLDLIRVKVERTLKNLQGAKRREFILFVLASLLFFFGGTLTGNLVVFTAFIERLRALLGMDGEEDLRGALIDVYLEYNAPLPEDLANTLESIK